MKDGRSFQVPYRSLLPVQISNLLAAGRCISADHVAESGTRAISLCCMTGEAAGAAAAMAVRERKSPKDIDVRALQEQLKRQNIELPV